MCEQQGIKSSKSSSSSRAVAGQLAKQRACSGLRLTWSSSPTVAISILCMRFICSSFVLLPPPPSALLVASRLFARPP